MKFGVQLLIAAILVAAFLPARAGENPPAAPARLEVQAGRPGVKISPLLYGIFYEEINCAGDGGLYAELIRNRSLEDSERPDHWSLVQEGSCQAEMELVKKETKSEFNRQALRLRITRGGSPTLTAVPLWALWA